MTLYCKSCLLAAKQQWQEMGGAEVLELDAQEVINTMGHLMAKHACDLIAGEVSNCHCVAHCQRDE